MADWMGVYGVQDWGIPNPFVAQQQRQAAQQQQLAQVLERMRAEQAINSPFVQGLIGDLQAPVERPDSFMPQNQLAPLLGTAQGITGQFPRALGVNMPPGGRGLPPAVQGAPSPAPQAPPVDPRVELLDPTDPATKAEFERAAVERDLRHAGVPEADMAEWVQAELEKRARQVKPGGRKFPKNEQGQTVIDVSGANWVKTEPELKLMSSAIPQGRRDQPVSPMRSGGLGARSPVGTPRTPEELAIFQSLLPQLSQRRVAQEQAYSAEERKNAELRQKMEQLQTRTGYDVWAQSLRAATALETAAMAARSRLGAAAQKDKRLQDLFKYTSLIHGELSRAEKDLSDAVIGGLSASQNPYDQQRFAELQARARRLTEEANSLSQNWGYTYNTQYGDNVPTRNPQGAVPRGPGAAQKTAPAVPGESGLSPGAQSFLDSLPE